jgi:FMN-dependent NADH-azoreductase
MLVDIEVITVEGLALGREAAHQAVNDTLAKVSAIAA